jgi:hypothetical protein
MSSRAIQRLREERGAAALEPANLDGIEEEEEVHERRQPAFLAMMDDSDTESEQESDESEEADEGGGAGNDAGETKDTTGKTDARKDTISEAAKQTVAPKEAEPELQKEEEDLDAILAEFESKDEVIEDSKPSAPWFHSIVSNMDTRDLDIDYVMRTSLLGGAEEGPPPAVSRRSRQSFLFGPPRDGWMRPPHFVGGGIGMTSYDNADGHHLPWPYSSQPNNESLHQAHQQWQDTKHWFTFVRSDTYNKDLKDYERIQNSGDVNALALFVAHHPFVVEALLQLATVLYRTNQNQEGLSLLRRSLWILECSSLPSFRPLQGADCFMDYDQEENKPYFLALFRMIQISGMQG